MNISLGRLVLVDLKVPSSRADASIFIKKNKKVKINKKENININYPFHVIL